MKAQRELQCLLDAHGAVLCRRRKHLIYKLPDGRILTVSQTASDQRAMQNALSDLKRDGEKMIEGINHFMTSPVVGWQLYFACIITFVLCGLASTAGRK